MREGQRVVESMRWGFPPLPGIGNRAPVANVRNTASAYWQPSSPSKGQRCVVPATALVEPDCNTSKPVVVRWFRRIDGEPFFFRRDLARMGGRPRHEGEAQYRQAQGLFVSDDGAQPRRRADPQRDDAYLLMTRGDVERWLKSTLEEALELQSRRPAMRSSWIRRWGRKRRDALPFVGGDYFAPARVLVTPPLRLMALTLLLRRRVWHALVKSTELHLAACRERKQARVLFGWSLVFLAPLVAGDLPCFAGLRLACTSQHHQCSRNDQGSHLSPSVMIFRIGCGAETSAPAAAAALNVHHTTVIAARKAPRARPTVDAPILPPAGTIALIPEAARSRS
ncbi:MAG: hypothetical protein AB7G10_23265 [Reyranellaceae bacterium]